MVCQTTKPAQSNVTALTSRTGKILEGVGVLVNLGLSERQARVYLALLRAKNARARAVANAAGVPRQEVYGLLLELQQLGLAMQNLTVPTTYTATPLIETARMLFEQKASELTLISQKAKRLTKKFSQNPPTMLPEVPKPCFGAVSEGERGKKYSEAIQGAQGCIEFVTSWVRFRQLCFHFEGELKAALKRGVRVRVATEKPPRHNFPKWINTLNNPAFELRTTPNPPAAVIAIFDGVQVAVAFDTAIRLTKGPELWTSHRGLVAVCCGYFDRLWDALE